MNKPELAISRIGNLVISTKGNKKDEDAWIKIKEYIRFLELSSDENCNHIYEEHNYRALLCSKCGHIELEY